MDAKAALQALSDGDMFALANALEWDECRRFTVEPPAHAKALFEGMGMDLKRVSLDRMYARRGSAVLRVAGDECHPELIIHQYDTVEAAQEAFRSFEETTERTVGMARAVGGAVTDTGTLQGARGVVVPDSPAAIGWTPPPSSPW